MAVGMGNQEMKRYGRRLAGRGRYDPQGLPFTGATPEVTPPPRIPPACPRTRDYPRVGGCPPERDPVEAAPPPITASVSADMNGKRAKDRWRAAKRRRKRIKRK